MVDVVGGCSIETTTGTDVERRGDFAMCERIVVGWGSLVVTGQTRSSYKIRGGDRT